MTTIEKFKCRCGLDKVATATRKGPYYQCPNCDTVQDRERGEVPLDRVITSEDRVYDEVVDRLSKGWFPRLGGGMKKPSGWPSEPGSSRHNLIVKWAGCKKKEDDK